MFNYDSAMSDTESHVFTNVSQPENESEDIPYNIDDFDNTVYPDDLVMKIVFVKGTIIEDKYYVKGKPYAKYVVLDSFQEVLDDEGIEYQDYCQALEGRAYLQMKQEGTLARE